RTFDGLELFKTADLGNQGVRPETDLTQIEIWSQFLNSLQTANIIGFGSYTFKQKPAPYVLRIINESVIDQQYFQSIKFFFSFTTHGSFQSKAMDKIAEHMNKRLNNAKFLGKIDFHCPENYPPILPKIGEKDKWDNEEIVRLTSFEQDLIRRIHDPDFKGEKFAISNKDLTVGQKEKYLSYGIVEVDTNLCLKCGVCERNCPYNAIKLKDYKDGVVVDNINDSEAGAEGVVRIPTVDQERCQLCARCYNNCPAHAINFVKYNTHLRSQYKGPQLKFVKIQEDEQERIDIRGEQPVEFGKLPGLLKLLLRKLY
ncbi:MAG: hypothetical protein EZS28_020059, partial [Streblomastix strix]